MSASANDAWSAKLKIEFGAREQPIRGNAGVDGPIEKGRE
jgi:hypothetical protein